MLKEVDYIIVGSGLAGISFCEQLRTNNKSFVVFDDASQHSSTVAGGLYNPVILKRFTPVWKGEAQIGLALPMYKRIEELLEVKLDYKVPVYRKFSSIEEQNNWFAATDNPVLSDCLGAIIKNNNEAIDAPLGFGEVKGTGRIDTKLLIASYRSFLKDKNVFFEERFSYDDIEINDNKIRYKTIATKHIVFAEGFGIAKNPFFKNLPLVPTKGELLTIRAPDLKIDYVLKGPVFLIPIGNDLYRVGSTYEWHDLTNKVTNRAKDYLSEKLKTLITCSFEVVNHVAGIRPTVKSRRPLVGQHQDYKNVYVLNGLGTRGVMIGPYVAKQLYDFIEEEHPLDPEIDIARFN